MLSLVWNYRCAFQQIDGTRSLLATKLFLCTFHKMGTVCQESSFLTQIAISKKVFVNPKFGKYNPQNLAPCHSESLSYLKTLTCKWRLNCAVEPNSLQTDARHHGTFKGQGKKNMKFKKGDEANSASLQTNDNHMTKIIRQKKTQKVATLLYNVIYYLRLLLDSKPNVSTCSNGCLVTVERSPARRNSLHFSKYCSMDQQLLLVYFDFNEFC